MKWILIIFLTLCMIGLVSASEDAILTFTTSENVLLNTLCYTDAGVRCTGVNSCDINVYYPNWTFLNASQMTFKANGFFSKDLGKFNIVGDFKSSINCTSGGLTGISKSDFRISDETNGTIFEEFNMIALVLLMAGIIGLFFYISAIGKQFITNIDWLKEFIGFLSVNIALILIPVCLGMVTKIFQNSEVIVVLDNLYIVSWWIVGTIILINLIINLWSFIPIMWKKTLNLIGNW